MSARFARRVISTIAVAIFVPAPAAAAAPPTCVAPAAQTTVEDGELFFFAWEYCTDSDGDALTFAVTVQPEHGTVVNEDGVFRYAPDPDYWGPDGFSFTASDGTTVTPDVPVPITVARNQPPVCSATIVLVIEPNTPTPLYPYNDCSDERFDLSFSVVDPPAHGTVAPYNDVDGFVYEPQAGYSGPDSFTFRASDGEFESELVTVEITVRLPNHAPHCVSPLTVRVRVGGEVPLDYRTACTDPEGDPISPELIAGPSHGELEVRLPLVIYRPTAGYRGSDVVRYRVSDDRGATSNVATVNLIVGTAVTPGPPPDTVKPAIDLVPVGKQKLKAARRKGLRLLLRSSEAGGMVIKVSVSKRAARRLRIDRDPDGPVVIGRAARSITAGQNKITIKLSRKARKRLAHARKLTLLVQVRVVDGAGNAAVDTLRMTVRR